MKFCEITAKTADEAIELALTKLNTTIDMIDIEIFEESSKGLLGFLKPKEVRVKATLKETPADVAKRFLSEILINMNIDAKIDAKMSKDSINIEMSGENMAILIGRRGQTLDSLQYLVSLVVNKDRDDYYRVVLDTEDYRNKREESLIKLANKLAYKARKYRKDIILEPMNPYERRIIHSALQTNKFVSTRSEGDEPFRKVIIFLNK